MKDAIIIKVKETKDSVDIECETNICVSRYGRCKILQSVLKVLEFDVNWRDPGSVMDLMVKMIRAESIDFAEEVE